MIFDHLPTASSFFEALQADFDFFHRRAARKPELYHRMEVRDPWAKAPCSCSPWDLSTPTKSSSFAQLKPIENFEHQSPLKRQMEQQKSKPSPILRTLLATPVKSFPKSSEEVITIDDDQESEVQLLDATKPSSKVQNVPEAEESDDELFESSSSSQSPRPEIVEFHDSDDDDSMDSDSDDQPQSQLTTTIVESQEFDPENSIPFHEEKFAAHLNLCQFEPKDISVQVLEQQDSRCPSPSRKRTLEVRGRHSDHEDGSEDYECLEYVKRLSLPVGVATEQLRCTLDSETGHLVVQAPILEQALPVGSATTSRAIPIQLLESPNKRARMSDDEDDDDELICIE